MGKKISKNPLAAKLDRALASHAADETNYGMEFVDLPGGIGGGVAQFVDGRIGRYKTGRNEGETYLYLAGIVIEPKTAVRVQKAFVSGKLEILGSEQVTVQGQRTSLTLPLCETTNRNGDVTSLDDNVERVLNEVRKVGGEECTAGVNSLEDLGALMETLKEEKPYFRFSTTSSDPTAEFPNPRVWENWHGNRGLEDYEAEESEDVEDGTRESFDAEEEPASESSPTKAEEEPVGYRYPPSEPEDDEGTPDLNALAEAADAEDTDAATTLKQLAMDAGVDEDDIDNAEDWAEVVTLMESGGNEEDEEKEEEEEEEEGDWAPEKGEVYFYKPPRAKKNVECEVTAVFSGKQTINLKSLDDGKTWKAVDWDKLIRD